MLDPAAMTSTAASFAPATICVYVGLDLVGDGLMKLPFLRALRAAYPQARITWLAGKIASDARMVQPS